MSGPICETSRWITARSEEVNRRARIEIGSHVASATQGEFMSRALDASVCTCFPDRYHASVHLPLLVHAALTGEDEPAVPLAAACTLLWVGAELYDNLTDGDLTLPWQQSAPYDIVFAATAISCVLPPAIIANLLVPEERRLAMLRELSAGLLRMFDGQQRDLALTDARELSSAEVEASVVGKNGVPKAFFAGLGAHMAGADAEIRAAYMEYAMALGVAYQLQSDSFEMFSSRRNRDLEQGTRTLHVALCLEMLSGGERENFLEVLDLARTNREAQEEVRNRLRKADVIRPWTEVVRRYVEKGRAALEAAGPKEPAGAILRELLEARSPRCT